MVQVKELVSNNLVNARKTHGWSQAFVSRQTGISIRTISRAENSQGISKYTLNQLASFYAVPVENFYLEHKQNEYKVIAPIPFHVIADMLVKTDFVNVVQQETLYRFRDIVEEKTLMYKEDVAKIVKDTLGIKESYSYYDLIKCGLYINRESIKSVGLVINGKK